MKSLFEQMGGTYRREGAYLIPNLALPDTGDNQIGKYGHMRHRYLKEHRKVLYTNLLTLGNLRRHLAEIDQPAMSVWKASYLFWQGRKA